MTSDDVLTRVAALRKGVPADDMEQFRAEYFSKGQPCFRASPLTKTHGWAVHSDANGYVTLLSPESPQCIALYHDPSVRKVSAMRSKRA